MEEIKKLSSQQYKQFSESPKLTERVHKISKEKVTNMAPNFRIIKFIYEQLKQDKKLYQIMEKVAVELETSSVRTGLMRLIANHRKTNDQFNIAIQNLTRLDYQLAEQLKFENKTNQEIIQILDKNEKLNQLVKIVVNEIRTIVQ